ncbi:MAG TPA: prephenate dehydratase [bacterium]|nr:prephenate dehydratase [bacterium]
MKKSPQNLKKFRDAIDRIDTQLVRLLNDRAKNVLKIKSVKAKDALHFYAPHREMEVYRRVGKLNKGPFSAEALKAVFGEIMSASLALESRLKIAYFGQVGTNTHIAALQKFGSSSLYTPGFTLKDVFQEVERGRAQYGVVPIENSTEGTINHTLDLFVESDLKICSEIYMPITYTLMSKSGDLSKVKRVYSHPQALGQCRVWLEANLPGVKIVESANTAKAAQTAASEAAAAAIAPDMAAKLYQLKPIARRIEDMQDNYTRFLVIGRTLAERTGNDKTSLMVSIKDKVGALFALLYPFEKRGLNLTSIESRPSRKKAWDYYFFIDFLGHISDPNVREAIREIEKSALTVKVLGSYPRSET